MGFETVLNPAERKTLLAAQIKLKMQAVVEQFHALGIQLPDDTDSVPLKMALDRILTGLMTFSATRRNARRDSARRQISAGDDLPGNQFSVDDAAGQPLLIPDDAVRHVPISGKAAARIVDETSGSIAGLKPPYKGQK